MVAYVGLGGSNDRIHPGITMTHDTVTTRALVDTLAQELTADPASGVDEAGTAGSGESDPASALDSAVASLPTGEDLAFDPDLVTGNLDEILVALIALRGADPTHGQALIDDVESLFGTRPSPGTVYPRLHDIEEEGLLGVRELVRTKEYAVADGDRADRLLADAAYRHLALGLFLHASLAER